MPEFHWKPGEVSHLRVKGQMLEAACYGPSPEHSPTITLLHEGLGCVSLWRDFPRCLAEATGFGVFAYSRAGYGTSSPAELPRPIDYMTREAVDILPGVLDAFGFQNGILLGHSDGASIAAIYSGSVIDHRVRGLVLIAPHFFTEPEGLSSIREAKIAYDEADLKERLAKYHTNVDNAFRGWNDAWLNPEFEDWNIAEVIDYLRIPVLAIQGKDDQYGTLAQIEELVQRAYSPVEVFMPENCQHSPHLEKPEAVLNQISSFLDRLYSFEKQQVCIG